MNAPQDPSQPGAYPPQPSFPGQGAATPPHSGHPGYPAPPPHSGYSAAQQAGFPPPPQPGYPPHSYAPPLPGFEGERGQLLRIFVANNAERYMHVFHKLEASRGQLSWNWSAFFANIFWLAHRKLYLPAGIAAGIMLVLVVIGGLIGLSNLALLYIVAFIVPIAIAAAIGVFGDSMLKRRADRELGQIVARYPDPHSRAAAAAATGGTSGIALAIALVGWFGINSGLYAADLSPYKHFEKNRYQRGFSYR